MHWCQDETFALMMLIPGLTVLVNRIRAWWYKKHECHHVEVEQ